MSLSHLFVVRGKNQPEELAEVVLDAFDVVREGPSTATKVRRRLGGTGRAARVLSFTRSEFTIEKEARHDLGEKKLRTQKGGRN